MANTAKGDLIRASHFNDIRNKIAPILGTGSGQSGYGQTLSSAEVASSSNNIWGFFKNALAIAILYFCPPDS
jgi:hypothetical protein